MTSDVDDDDLKSNNDDDSWAENELPDDEKDEVDDDTFALHLAASSVEDNASSNARNSRDEQLLDNLMSQQEKTDPSLSQDGFSFADPSQSSGENRSVPSLSQDGFAFGDEQSPKALQP